MQITVHLQTILIHCVEEEQRKASERTNEGVAPEIETGSFMKLGAGW